MILNPKLETMSENSLRQLQLERLQAILNRVYYNVEYYKTKFDEIIFGAILISTGKFLNLSPVPTIVTS
ncbi:MAG TPA: hypothetical protein PLM75_04060 [bacterium]|nr:hypothetical protein [bacterium]